MRKHVIAFCFLGFIAFSTATAQNWFTGSLDDAVAKAKSEGRPLLIDFFTEVG